MNADPRIAALEAEGYVVLRAKSHRQAQERQRVAEALRRAAEERVESVHRWAERAFDEQRRLSDRLTFVYGVARAYGATVDDLAGEPDERAALARVELAIEDRDTHAEWCGLVTHEGCCDRECDCNIASIRDALRGSS